MCIVMEFKILGSVQQHRILGRGQVKTERGSLEEVKSGVGREDILMKVQGWVAT